MKTILSFLVAMSIMASRVSAGTGNAASVDPRVLKAFTLTFPAVNNAKWYEDAEGYTAAFTTPQVSVIARYNKEGELVKLRRSYSKELLALPVLIKIEKKYSGKQITGITEVTTAEEIVYEVTLKDQSFWYKVISDNTGKMELIQKFKRAE